MVRKKGNAAPPSPPPRMQTRAANADKHPGAQLQAALRIRRDPAVIQKEKEEKKARKEAKEHQLAQDEAAESEVEEYHSQQKIKAQNEDSAFPRQRPTGGTLLPAM